MIKATDLTVISVMQNDSGLAALMVDSVKLFSKEVDLIIADQGGNGAIIKDIKKRFPVKTINNSVEGVTNTSLRHAMGLNKLIPMVKTKYTAIVESDCVVLRNDWFDFDTDKFDIMASLKKNEFSEEQYHVCFLVFKTDLLAGMDWSPIKKTKPIKFWRDTGFRIYSHIGGRTDRIFYLHIKNKSDFKIFNDKFNYKSFEIYKDDGMPIAAHFGRGSDLHRRPGNKIGSPKHQKREWAKIYHEFANKNNG